ncbi:MAG TPA: hypothetical protein VL422_17345 [Miltoncostaea sp.]|nr:hypothetical protein [Miltoncostaea sp.]
MDLDASDYIAIVSLVVAVAALSIGAYHENRRRADARRDRTEDLERAAVASARANILELLVTADAGIRSVEALANDEASSARLVFLRRTARQLEIVGERELGTSLETLCECWSNEPGSAASTKRRDEFLDLVRARFGSP